MLFNSSTFFGFLVVVFLARYSMLSWRARKTFLLLASYVFYAAWNPPFVVLLWLSTIADWFVARGIARRKSPGARKGLLLLSLGINLGLLGFFKYGTFALENFVALCDLLGWAYEPQPLDIILPVGISFYTFQTLSYTIDVYRRQMEPWDDFGDYALYVTFFPQLVAGPIVRAQDFLPQCRDPRPFAGHTFAWGLVLLTLGLFQKVAVADFLLAPVTDALFTKPADPSFIDAWVGTLAFSGQIFCDFAGYSLCAIGVALCLGFSIVDNFRFPYAAVGFQDFWRRWHISLSTWLRDYLYISLGGNRRGPRRTYVNLMATMLIGGLWHGASWTFVVWGGLHGLYLAIERLLQPRFRGVTLRGWLRFALGLATFAAICVTWVFFRASSFADAAEITLGMLGFNGGFGWSDATLGEWARARTLMVVGALVGLHWVLRNTTLEEAAGRIPWWLRSVTLALMLAGLFVAKEDARAFIYFQF